MASVEEIVSELAGELRISNEGAGDLFLHLLHTGSVTGTPSGGFSIPWGRKLWWPIFLQAHLNCSTRLVTGRAAHRGITIPAALAAIEAERTTELAVLIAQE